MAPSGTRLDDGSLQQNLEIKARVADVERLTQLAQQLATDVLPIERQLDTYFCCTNGRLKLREIELACGERTARLIHYLRADLEAAKPSHYRITPVVDAASFRAVLTSAYGVWRTVEKRREVFLYENVRIHIDRVTGLGNFMELEAVQSSATDPREQEALVERLATWLGIGENDLLTGSYSDLLAETPDDREPEQG